MIKFVWAVLVAGIVLVKAAPSGDFEANGSAQVSGSIFPPMISLDKGSITINFLGFRASAGLGALLTGNPADGGLHAEASTPFGQRAGAGLNVSRSADGNNVGYKYSYAVNDIVTNKRPNTGVQTVNV